MIEIDQDSFRQHREGGNVTGIIYLRLADGGFPDEMWSDFPVIILGWWTNAWLQLEEPTRRGAQWSFMDGPYRVSLAKVKGPLKTDTFEFFEVRESLVKAGERVIAHCKKHKMLSKDLENLVMNLHRLKANRREKQAATPCVAPVAMRVLLMGSRW